MTSQEPEKKSVPTYYIIPPMIPSYYDYQDINQDPKLRIDVVNYYYHKLLKWVSSSSMYKEHREHKDDLHENKNKVKKNIHKLLKYFVKQARINWYELRSNHIIIKEFFSKKFDLLL
jgi:hypothetical protein